jgi:hypothetical protein
MSVIFNGCLFLSDPMINLKPYRVRVAAMIKSDGFPCVLHPFMMETVRNIKQQITNPWSKIESGGNPRQFEMR